MIKKQFKILKILIISVLMLVLIIPPYLSKAQPEALKSALNEIIQREEVVEEDDNKARKVILLKILNLLILETEELKEKLNNLEDLEGEYLNLQSQFLTKLNGYSEYLQVLKEKPESGLETNELKDLIEDFKNWQESDYNPEVKKIMDFVLAFQQKPLFLIAEKRFEKISKDLQKTKLPKGNKIETLNRLLKEARISLDEAKKVYLIAQELLLPNATSTEVSLNQTLDVRELIKGAINKIKDAYQKFFQISVLIKKLR